MPEIIEANTTPPVLIGLIHKGACGGMVAPLYDPTITEKELREMVGSTAFCMRCRAPVGEDDLAGEYVEADDGRSTDQNDTDDGA